MILIIIRLLLIHLFGYTAIKSAYYFHYLLLNENCFFVCQISHIVSISQNNSFWNSFMPIYSQGLRQCNHPKSEYSCQLQERVQQLLEMVSTETPNSERFKNHTNVIYFHTDGGLCNRILHFADAFFFALYSNRFLAFPEAKTGQMFAKRNQKIFEFPDLAMFSWKQSYSTHRSKFLSKNYAILNPDILLNEEKEDLKNPQIFPLFIYFSPIGFDAYQMFGLHMAHFLINFLCRIPTDHFDILPEVYKSMPPNLNLFGIHLRYHHDDFAFMTSIEEAMSIVLPFLQEYHQRKPSFFFISSDSQEIIDKIKTTFPTNSYSTNVPRKADLSYDTALDDILLLTLCKQRLSTHQSTFSFVPTARVGKRCYYFQRGIPCVLKFSKSYSGLILFFKHFYKGDTMMVNTLIRISKSNIQQVKTFYNHFVI
ncbi:hypothetical protein TRFO_24523 [Tritrichomonas foetus]|uniref:Uncharacterized protein n=1 Tax=Tritrichomonas foetus TaxID=1144522 RepID=A0A1J4KCC8_9EUKA|nr:hypothetical protein TRFO_24523 [Tritrichomonas foetus]|eukprot:OHT07340.1 hypothetical protein TRFO_24523 [Tritrichomonas foetus]